MLMIKKIRGGNLQPPPGQDAFQVLNRVRFHEQQENQQLK